MNAKLSFFALALLVSVSSFGQDRSIWRTSADVREGVVGSVVGTVTDIQSGNRFVVAPDDDKYSTIFVDTDALTTRGRGVGGGVGDVRADPITLLGRPVEAPQTGIGQTRDPGNISTPTASSATPTTAPGRLPRPRGRLLSA